MLHAKNIEHSADIVSQGGQTEFGADLRQTLHQEMTLIPPELDGAKGMLNQLLALLHYFRMSLNSSLNFFNDLFIHPAGDAPAFLVAGAFFFHRTLATGTGFVVTNMALFFNRVEAKGQGFSGRTGVGVSFRVINKLLFTK